MNCLREWENPIKETIDYFFDKYKNHSPTEYVKTPTIIHPNFQNSSSLPPC
jgi:hypothetical protein